MSAASDALQMVRTVFTMLSTAKDDGGPPPADLVEAALWALSHSPHLDLIRGVPPPRGALAELADLDPAARALVTVSEQGRTALAADLADLRPGRDGPALSLRRNLAPEGGR